MRELEIAGLAAADGLAGPAPTPPAIRGDGPKHADLHAECLNCGAALHGRYCSACGQSSDDHHRSIVHLAWEAVEGLTHLDGRLAKTLPLLLFRPGRLARDHFDGRRARHVPPFRLFLVTLLLFMLALEGAMHGGAGHSSDGGKVTVARNGAQVRVEGASPAQMAKLARGDLTPEQLANPDGDKDVAEALAASPRTSTDRRGRVRSPLEVWLRERLARAIESPEYFKLVVFTWAHRLAVLLLPIFAGQLALLYAWRRQFYIYDHLVVSMQFLSFVFLVSAAAWLPPQPIRGVLVFAAILWTPVNLFQLLRGAYGSGWVGAGVRTGLLWLSTQVVFALLLTGLLILGLQQL